MYTLKYYLQDFKWQLELTFKDMSRLQQVTFEKFNSIITHMERLGSEIEKVRNDPDLKDEAKDRRIEEQVKLAVDQFSQIHKEVTAEYERVQRAIKDKLYTARQQSDIEKLLSFMQETEIRQHIGGDLIKFIADYPKALENLSILSAIMHDPTGRLSAQAKQMNSGGGIDIEEMHLQATNPEAYGQLKKSEENARAADAAFYQAISYVNGMKADHPSPARIDAKIKLSELHV